MVSTATEPDFFLEAARTVILSEMMREQANTPDPLTTEAVLIRGLVRGGEWADADAFSRGVSRETALVLAADGRIVNCHPDACDAMARGALPLTWYTQIAVPAT